MVPDPDLGWHIKTGEYILKYGIPKTDPFSFTMSNYPYINHSWLSSVVIYLLFISVRLRGLSFFFALVAVAAVLIQHRASKNKSFLPLFFSLFVMLSFSGIRSQVFTWLFFSLELIFLYRGIKDKNNLLYLVPLTFLWVNMHGGFSLGIITYVVYTIWFIVKRRGAFFYYTLLLFVVVFITMFNPYGIGIWREVFSTVGSIPLHFSIREWLPAIYFIHLPFWFYTGLCTALFILYVKKLNPFTALINTFLFISAFISIRNIPLWMISSFVLWDYSTSLLIKDIFKNKKNAVLFNKAQKVFMIVLILISTIQSAIYISSSYSSKEEKIYPTKAILYMKDKNIRGNVFSLYGWGGYLLWKVPGVKTFIDGRMPVWAWKQKDPRYSDFAYGEYLDLLNQKIPFEKAVNKYHIAYVLYPTPPSSTKGFWSQIEKKLRVLFGQRDEMKNPFQKFKKIYEDDVATLYSL